MSSRGSGGRRRGEGTRRNPGDMTVNNSVAFHQGEEELEVRNDVKHFSSNLTGEKTAQIPTPFHLYIDYFISLGLTD